MQCSPLGDSVEVLYEGFCRISKGGEEEEKETMGSCASKSRSADSNPQLQQEQVSTSELNLEEDDYLRKYSRSKRSLSVLFKAEEEEEEEREHLLKHEIQEKDVIQQHKVSKPSFNAKVSRKQENSTTKIQPPVSEIQHGVVEDNVKVEASEASVQNTVEAATKPESGVSQPSVNAVVSEKLENLTMEIQSLQSKIQNVALGDNVKLEASENSAQGVVEAPAKSKNDEKQENSQIQDAALEDSTKLQASKADVQKLIEAPTKPKNGTVSEKQEHSQIQDAALEDNTNFQASQAYVQKPIEAPTETKSEVSKPSANAAVSEKQENLRAKIQSLSSEIQNDVLKDNVKLEASEASVQMLVEASTMPKIEVAKPSANAIASEKHENLTAKIQLLPSEIQNIVIEDSIKIEASQGYEEKLAEAPMESKSGVSKPSVNTSENHANLSPKIQSLPSEIQTVVIEESVKLEASQAYVQQMVEDPAKPKSEVSKPPGNARVCEEQETSITKIQYVTSEICNVAIEDNVKVEASQAYVQKPIETPTKHSSSTVGSDISCTNEKTEVGTVLLEASGNADLDLAPRNPLKSGIRLQNEADHTSNIVEDRHLGTTKPIKGISDVGDSWKNSVNSEINFPMVDGSENKDLEATGFASGKYIVDNDGKVSFNPGFNVPSVGLNHSSIDIEDKNLEKSSSRTENIDLKTVEDLHGALTGNTEQNLESEKTLGIDPPSSITSVSIPVSSNVAPSTSSGKELEEGSKTEGRMKWVGEGEMRAESGELEVVDAQAGEEAAYHQALESDHLVTKVGTETRDLHHNAQQDNESLGNNIVYSSKIHKEKLSQKDQSLVIESAVEESCATTSTHITEEPEEYNADVPIMEGMKGAPDNSVYAKHVLESAVMEADHGPRDTSFETSRKQDPLK